MSKNFSGHIWEDAVKWAMPAEPVGKRENDPGDYYSNKSKAANYWHEELQQAGELLTFATKLVHHCRQRLEAARYVGD